MNHPGRTLLTSVITTVGTGQMAMSSQQLLGMVAQATTEGQHRYQGRVCF